MNNSTCLSIKGDKSLPEVTRVKKIINLSVTRESWSLSPVGEKVPPMESIVDSESFRRERKWRNAALIFSHGLKY